MKKSRLWLIGLMTFFFSGIFVSAIFAGTVADENSETTTYLQDITFDKLPGKERISLTFSKASGVMIENKSSNSVVAIMANTYIPEDLRRTLDETRLDNIYRITVSQQDKDGQPWGYVSMEMRERAPYMVRKDGSKILVDFNVAGLIAKANRSTDPLPSKAQKSTSRSTEDALATKANNNNQFAKDGEGNPTKLVSIDFQEANIKSVLRLLAEEGGINIASGEDVKGNVTINIKRLPWKDAFETVLAVHGLGRIKEGEVYVVKTLDRMKKEAETRREETKKRLEAEANQEFAEQEKRVKDGRLPQIAIEAKIVEVSRSGSRELGILWGVGWKNKWGGKDVGFAFGSNPLELGRTSTYTLKTPTSGDVGLAVNLPSAVSAPNPTLGVIVSSANAVLAAKLEALETAGNGRIISAPKVTTLDSEKAKIGQGEEIPYVTRDEDGVQKVEMKDAKLELEVTPRITSEGKISLKVVATNKAADWEKVNKNNENPPLIASNVESKVVVSDGDTLVLGGIMKKLVTKSTTGIPWLHKIPVLGWLFKTEEDVLNERELLIFVTPRIVRAI